MSEPNKGKWRYNASALKGYVKKPVGFEAWFYTGPSFAFGHFPSRKSGKR